MPEPVLDLTAAQLALVREILHRHVPNLEVWAFGSRTRATAKPYSDLDLAILSDHPLDLAVQAALADEFSESDLPWKVDLVDWSTTSESFRRIIERDKIVVQTAFATAGSETGKAFARPDHYPQAKRST